MAKSLPARQFISLDTLITRAKTPRRGPQPVPPRPRTLAELERDSSIAPRNAATAAARFVRPPTPPSALIMWITVARCTSCGRVHRVPPAHVLIRYSENEHSFHDKRDDTILASLPADLPREVKTRDTTIPFCEECFV